MTSLAAIILQAHRSQLRIHGVPVVYRSQTAGAVEVDALRVQSFARLYDDDGAFTTIVAEDFQIAVEDLVDDDEIAFEPTVGDAVLVVGDSGLVAHFEVLPWADEPAKRFADVARQVFRIHTKQTREFLAGQLLDESGAPLIDEDGAPLIDETVTV